MLKPSRLAFIGRRDVMVGAGAAAAIAALLASGVSAQEKAPATLDEALKRIMGDAKPAEGKISLELPEIAENGNTVPFTIGVDSPMTEKDHVKAVHILAAGNPQPGVGTFHFNPGSGRATVSSRMRLARTQDVVAVAELSDARFLLARRTVKVTIGGCGG